MDEDAEFSTGVQAPQAAEPASEEPNQTVQQASAKRRGRPKTKGKKKQKRSSASSAGSGSGKSGKKPVIKAQGKAAAKAKSQCMGCGKVFPKSAMANLRYCLDDKKVTDRIYHAASAQGQTEWVSDQLSTLEGSMRLCNTYKARFPEWKQSKTPTKGFVTQYREMIRAETSVVHSGDGIMVDENRYCLEMAKPERGGMSAKSAAAEFQRLLADPSIIRDKHQGRDRIRLQLDDHVAFENKYSRLKEILTTSTAKKDISEQERETLLGKVMSEHNTFAGSNVDMHPMAQSMALGAGKSASAFDANLMKIGDIVQSLKEEVLHTPEKKKPTNPYQDDDEAGAGDEEAPEPSEKEEKWLDVDREITKHTRTMNAWIQEAATKCLKSWEALRDLEMDDKTKEVEMQVAHDLEVASGKRRALGHVLGFDCSDSAPVSPPSELSQELASQRMKQYIADCKARADMPKASPVKGEAGNPTASAASAAGDRARLGQAAPCKSYQDLITLQEAKDMVSKFMGCSSRDEFKGCARALQTHQESLPRTCWVRHCHFERLERCCDSCPQTEAASRL